MTLVSNGQNNILNTKSQTKFRRSGAKQPRRHLREAKAWPNVGISVVARIREARASGHPFGWRWHNCIRFRFTTYTTFLFGLFFLFPPREKQSCSYMVRITSPVRTLYSPCREIHCFSRTRSHTETEIIATFRVVSRTLRRRLIGICRPARTSWKHKPEWNAIRQRRVLCCRLCSY